MDRRLPPSVTEENVPVTVKWFNSSKGFGFVTAEEGGNRDVFIHASVLTEHGYNELPDGTSLVVDLMETQRGMQVAAVHSVDTSTAQPSSGRSGGPGGGGYDRGPRDRGGFDRGDRGPRREFNDGPLSDPIDGTVKFFDPGKGYGFIVMDDGSRDVFVASRALERAGLQSLEPEQRVRVQTRMGQKGPMAESVEVI